MKTSTALFHIIKQNNNKIHMSQFGKWIRKLIDLGYLEIKNGYYIGLTEKGLNLFNK